MATFEKLTTFKQLALLYNSGKFPKKWKKLLEEMKKSGFTVRQIKDIIKFNNRFSVVLTFLKARITLDSLKQGFDKSDSSPEEYLNNFQSSLNCSSDDDYKTEQKKSYSRNLLRHNGGATRQNIKELKEFISNPSESRDDVVRRYSKMYLAEKDRTGDYYQDYLIIKERQMAKGLLSYLEKYQREKPTEEPTEKPTNGLNSKFIAMAEKAMERLQEKAKEIEKNDFFELNTNYSII